MISSQQFASPEMENNKIFSLFFFSILHRPVTIYILCSFSFSSLVDCGLKTRVERSTTQFICINFKIIQFLSLLILNRVN